MRRIGLIVAPLVPLAFAATSLAQPAPTLIGSTADGSLLVFRADRPQTTRPVHLRGISGQLLGVDFSALAGFAIVTDAGVDRGFATTGGKLYTVDLPSGAATLVGPIGDSPVTLVSLTATTEPTAP